MPEDTTQEQLIKELAQSTHAMAHVYDGIYLMADVTDAPAAEALEVVVRTLLMSPIPDREADRLLSEIPVDELEERFRVALRDVAAQRLLAAIQDGDV